MYTYPFNPHFTNPECNILREPHQLTIYNSTDYYYVIPKYAPFAACSVNVQDGAGNEMTEEKDYNLIMPYVSATRACGVSVYCGFSFNAKVADTVYISYMTIGGKWVSDTVDVWRELAVQTYNPRLVYWDQIQQVPGTFPPIDHSVQHSDFDEFGSIIHAVGAIAKAVDRNETPSHIMEYLINTRSNKFYRLEQKQLELEARINLL